VLAHSVFVIVLLNGASSAGKTTLAKALPGRWLSPPLWHEVFGYDGPPEALTITAGAVGTGWWRRCTGWWPRSRTSGGV